jgi:NDP-sugar pyrophosphorylase family protein
MNIREAHAAGQKSGEFVTEIEKQSEFGALSVLILAGGLGSRLKKAVWDRPKPMADINGRPFLDMIIEHASGCGLGRFVLCTGHMGDLIRTYYAATGWSSRIAYSQESRLLGTAGAVKNAEPLIESDPFIVMNGDSLCPVDLHEFYRFHRERAGEISMVVTRMKRAGDYGTLRVNKAGRVEGFEEKTGKGTYVNAGIYCMGKEILSTIPAGTACSLERDVFPALVYRRFYAFVTSTGFTDIGTPGRYREAKRRFTPPVRRKEPCPLAICRQKIKRVG